MADQSQNQNTEEATTFDMKGIVSQLEELVKMTLECEKKELKPDVPFAEVNTQLKALKEVLEGLHEAYLATLKDLALNEQDVSKFKVDVEKLKEPEKKLYNTLSALNTVCESARERLYKSLQENREQLRDVEAERLEKSKKGHRLGKFKSVGGKKGWMPT
jgi:DNA repair exonuclease SbcCD ATPase subunit